MHELATERLSRLFQAAAQVAGQSDLRALLWTIVETSAQLTGAKYAAMGIVGSHGTVVEFLTVGLEPEAADQIGPPPRGNGLLGAVTRMRKTVRLDRISDHPDAIGFPPGHPVMDTFLGVPVRAGERVVGNLYLTNKEGGFTDQDETMVEALALVGGSAVSTLQLQERLRRLAVVQDRERIARDVHDEIIQDLFAVGLSLQALSLQGEDPSVTEKLDQAVHKLDDAIASLREFIFDLRRVPEARDIEGELQELIDELAEPYGCVPALDVAGQVVTLPEPVLAAMFHIVKEATSNALRHAGTHDISVNVMSDGTQAIVQVTDNGVGFDPNSVEGGMGLENLRARARAVDGTFTVMAAPGRGTTVRVELPVR